MKAKVFYSEMIKFSRKLTKTGFDDVLFVLKRLINALEKSEKANKRMRRAIKDQNRIIEEQHKEIKALREMMR